MKLPHPSLIPQILDPHLGRQGLVTFSENVL